MKKVILKKENIEESRKKIIELYKHDMSDIKRKKKTRKNKSKKISKRSIFKI